MRRQDEGGDALQEKGRPAVMEVREARRRVHGPEDAGGKGARLGGSCGRGAIS